MIIAKYLIAVLAGILCFKPSVTFGCEILRDRTSIEKEMLIIPVTVKPKETCKVLDNLDGDVSSYQNLMTGWGEKISYNRTKKFGKFVRDYRVVNDKVILDQFLYQANSGPGTDELKITFAASVYKLPEYSKLKYHSIILRVSIQ